MDMIVIILKLIKILYIMNVLQDLISKSNNTVLLTKWDTLIGKLQKRI